MSGRGANYSENEVQALVESYAELKELRDTTRARLRYVLSLADLGRALDRLYLDYWAVVLVHGLLGYSQYETAHMLQISQSAVSKRYRRGIAESTYWINNGGI